MSDMRNAGLTAGRAWYHVPVAHEKRAGSSWLHRCKVNNQQATAGFGGWIADDIFAAPGDVTQSVGLGRDPSVGQLP